MNPTMPDALHVAVVAARRVFARGSNDPRRYQFEWTLTPGTKGWAVDVVAREVAQPDSPEAVRR